MTALPAGLAGRDFERLEVEVDGPLLRIWLNRPEKRNALDQQTLREIGDAFLSLEQAFDIRAIVLGGRGESFSAGADRRETATSAPTDREQRWRGQLGRRATRAIEDCEIPTIARVQGHAAGGGSCLAVSCDFRITAESTQWWVPEVELGVPLTWSATPRLIQEIGMARARQYVMLSERVDGGTAAEWGLAHECVADDALDSVVGRWVDRVLAMSELAINMSKTQFRSYNRRSALGDVSETDGDIIARAQDTDDFRQRFADF